MTRINTNISSLTAQQTLATSNNMLQTTLTRLSTGLRINSGADDPAGLIAAADLGSDIKATQQAISNSQTANQMISTADSALGQISSLLTDIQGLVTQAANTAAMSSSQIAANQLQIDSSLSAVNRISQTTSFQGRNLLDGSLGFIVGGWSGTQSNVTNLQINQANLSSGALAVSVNVTTAATKAQLDTSVATGGVAATSGNITFAGTGKISLTAKAVGAAANGYTLSFAESASVPASTPLVSVSGKNITVTVNNATNTKISDVASALSGNSTVSGLFNVATSGIANANDSTTGNITFSAGGTLSLTAKTAGADGSGYTIGFQETGAVTALAPQAVINGKNITVYVNDAGTTTLGAIKGALAGNATINSLFTFADSADADVYTNGGTDAAQTGTTTNVALNDVYQAGTDTALTGTTAGGVATGLSADSVFELGGKDGTQVFNFKAGTTITDMAAAVNLATTTTGVAATINSDVLQLTSTAFGSNAFVNINTISGSQAFTLSDDVTSATRAAGTDIVGTVNGTQATGAGQNLSLNTAALSMSANISASGTYGFSVQSGGALFQLGPNVVGSEQAQIGIQSVSSGNLGGTAGRLFELGSGQDAALATNPAKAGQIVQSALDNVTSLRGRLVAFQKSTVDSNINALTDAVTNLTAAQSTIQDADFAAEIANLTRGADPGTVGHLGVEHRQQEPRERSLAVAVRRRQAQFSEKLRSALRNQGGPPLFGACFWRKSLPR